MPESKKIIKGGDEFHKTETLLSQDTIKIFPLSNRRHQRVAALTLFLLKRKKGLGTIGGQSYQALFYRDYQMPNRAARSGLPTVKGEHKS